MKNLDSDLIQKTIAGDQEAFSELVEKYQKQIHALVWQKVGDFHIAQEITQDVFLTAYHKLSTLKHHSRLSGWLYVIADNRCKNWFKKRRLEFQSLEETDPVELEEVYYSEYMTHQREEAANQKRRGIVQKLLSTLQESDRTVVNLYYIAEMPCEEIGKFLGMSPNTVRSKLHRARNRLKKEEAMIKDNLSSFQLPTQMTEHIMEKVSRLIPTAPSGNKPYIPLAISAASAILVVLLLGVGVQNLFRIQQPYSLTAQSERTVEIVDARLVFESPAKPTISNQVSRSDVLSNNDETGQEPGTSQFGAAQTDDTESTNFKGIWRQTNGPYGGKITTLYKTTHGVLLAGTEGAGIFRSTDNGNNWTPVNAGLYNEPHERSLSLEVTAITEKGNKIYVGTNEALYISTDIGNTWQHVSAIQTRVKTTGIVILDDDIYVSTYSNGVWQSNDDNSWAQINDGLGITFHGHLLDIDPRLDPDPSSLKPMYVSKLSTHGTTLVAATKRGLFRKMGDKDPWTLINPVVVEHSDGVESENNSQDKPESNPSPKQDSSSDFRIESFASMKHLLFVSGYMGKKSGIFRSNDVGETWMHITPEKVKEESDDVQTIAVQGGRLYAGTYDGLVYLSDDMGDSWIPINEGLMHDDVSTVLPINDRTVFIGTSTNGVFRTTDAGDSWIECNTGIINTSVSKLEVIGDKLYTVVGGKIVCSADGGGTWLPINDSSRQSKDGVLTICVSDGELYVDAYFGDDKFIPSHSGGEGDSVYRLNRENNTLVELFTDMDLYGIVSMDVVGTTFYIGTWDSGVSKWEQKTGLTKLGLEQHHYIWLLSANSEYVIAVTGDSEIYRFKENRWEPIHTAEMIDGGLSDLKRVGSMLYVTTWDNGVYRSEDGGGTWTTINDGLDETSATSIGTDGTEVYVSTTTGFFQWIEEKKHWKSIGSLTQQVSSLAVIDGFLYAGTFGSGVYKIPIEK